MKRIYLHLGLALFVSVSTSNYTCAEQKKADAITTEKTTPLDLTLPVNSQSVDEPELEIPTSVAGVNSNASSALPVSSSNGFGIAGSFYHRATLTGGLSVGGNMRWNPYSSFFVQSGVNYGYYPSHGKLTYSWGFGYDDWHPGTFSAQLNNWGPISPSEGLALSKASANLGYRFEADFLRPYNITGSAGVNIPIKGDPSMSTTWNWSPIEHWFIRASLQRQFGHKSGWNWTYNFGYYDWHPFTFSLTYDNWGTNQINSSQGNPFNFKEKGAVSLSWSWAF